MRFRKVLLVSSGLNTVKAFRNITVCPFVNINASHLYWYNLWGYDAIIILSTGDTGLMKKHSDRLKKYVLKGGLLVCLGVQDPNSEWTPFCEWNGKLPSGPLPLKIDSDDKSFLFKNIDIASLSFHDFFSHGSLIPPPENSTSLVLSNENKTIMCLIDEKPGGAALITTLDPDYHLAFGMRSMKMASEDEAEKARTQAQTLLENIIKWCLWKSSKCNSGKQYFLRKIKGILSFRFFLFVFIILWVFVLYITSKSLLNRNYDPIILCPGIASILGLLIVLIGKYYGLKE